MDFWLRNSSHVCCLLRLVGLLIPFQSIPFPSWTAIPGIHTSGRYRGGLRADLLIPSQSIPFPPRTFIRVADTEKGSLRAGTIDTILENPFSSMDHYTRHPHKFQIQKREFEGWFYWYPPRASLSSMDRNSRHLYELQIQKREVEGLVLLVPSQSRPLPPWTFIRVADTEKGGLRAGTIDTILEYPFSSLDHKARHLYK